MATRADKQRGIAILWCIQALSLEDGDGQCKPSDIGASSAEFGRALAWLIECGAVSAITLPVLDSPLDAIERASTAIDAQDE